jgi:hypothetical protein
MEKKARTVGAAVTSSPSLLTLKKLNVQRFNVAADLTVYKR